MAELHEVSSDTRYEVGNTYRVKLSSLVPTQKDDGRPSFRNAPIEAFVDNGKLLINNGHHRYYRKMKEVEFSTGEHSEDHYIEVTIVENPYFM
ncbi:MAG: hypothetical protein ACMG57_03835 [Candidatus Dojkabacteria bacterium]